MQVLVTGAGGFIGHHLVKRLKAEGHRVIGVDIKRPEFEDSPADDFRLADLRLVSEVNGALGGVSSKSTIDQVYHLAANMGGIGFISANFATICHDNSLININMLDAMKKVGCPFLFSSSACVYAQERQLDTHVTKLTESDAFPAQAEKGYGWEKLYMELLCQYYREEFGTPTRVVRFHNIYGPLGTYQGGREKAPAAVCRKISKLPREGGPVEVWGDGEATRSYCYIDDCIEGIRRLMDSEVEGPINLGSEELISVNDLYSLVADIAGKKIACVYDRTKPQGVRGRNSDNALLRATLGWEPKTRLRDGLRETYWWINEQVKA
jgi:GDP-D-mannose 3',5'-epimerase